MTYTTEEKMQIAGKLAGNYARYLPEADREDVKQDMLVAMLEAESKADQSRNVKAYTFTTGKGTALNVVNRMCRDYKRSESLNLTAYESDEGDAVEHIDLLEATDKGYVEGSLESERVTDISSAIASLPEVQATMVRRILIEGATLETAGSEAGFSKERARQVLEDAKMAMAFRLKDWEASVYA